MTATATVVVAAALGGCGTDNKNGAVVAERVSPSSCFATTCHAGQTDPVSGQVIRTQVEQSLHYRLSQNTADCQGCHGGGSMHFGVGPLPYANPAEFGGGCFTCHQENAPLDAAHYTTAKPGVDEASPASYVTPNVDCTFCHSAHSPVSTQIHEDWAEGHGNVNALAFAEESFGIDSRAACSRCHTTTGYIRFANSEFETAPTTGFAAAGDMTREVIACKACHSTSEFSANNLRPADAFTASYKYNGARVEYVDSGASNLCIPCHSGRESGDSVTSITNFTNASFKNPHYFPAAAMLFSKSGFRYYTSNAKYQSTNSHSQIGIGNYNGTGTNGACVACHLGPVGNSTHTFDPFEVADLTNGAGGCYGCHTPALGEPTILEENEHQKAIFARFLDFYKYELAQKGIFYGSAHPYFYTADGGTTAIKNWTTVGPTGGTGAKNMGAAFNYKFVAAEGGAHAHNRTFAKRLITDAIQYLQTGSNTYSFSSANNLAGGTNGQADPNSIISFSAYSTSKPTFTFTDPKSGVATDVSISSLKSELLRYRSVPNQWYRR